MGLKKLKEADSRERVITQDEIARLIKASKDSNNPYLTCVILIALTTGARKGEILGLKWTDIDFDNKIAYLIIVQELFHSLM